MRSACVARLLTRALLSDGGLGLGTLWTSVLFLGTILAVVVYLTVTRADVTEEQPHRVESGA